MSTGLQGNVCSLLGLELCACSESSPRRSTWLFQNPSTALPDRAHEAWPRVFDI